MRNDAIYKYVQMGFSPLKKVKWPRNKVPTYFIIMQYNELKSECGAKLQYCLCIFVSRGYMLCVSWPFGALMHIFAFSNSPCGFARNNMVLFMRMWEKLWYVQHKLLRFFKIVLEMTYMVTCTLYIMIVQNYLVFKSQNDYY